ncbi:hypothetical protein MKX03_024800 [Papaver bracteatum]|nr:hypothetical protein MKX03_024800 [Papaver bracteatum]
MGTRKNGNIILLFSLLFSVLISKGSSEYFDPVTVHVENNIVGDGIKLHIHCRSRDDDLGERTLGQGEEWHWKFRVVPTRTYFWCDLRWYDNKDHRWYSGNFDVYHASGIVNKYVWLCALNCEWSYRRDGAYLYHIHKHKWQRRAIWH